MIRVALPFHLNTLAGVDGEIGLDVDAPITQRRIVDALEARYPMLRGTIREHGTGKRRPLVRFFVNQEDITHDSADEELPTSIANGEQVFLVIGAIAGG